MLSRIEGSEYTVHRNILYGTKKNPCQDHRNGYLEQQQTEKIETEVRDVDRIRIMKVYNACCPGWPSEGGRGS
jgi:hypothetical protein